jgi:hypothetical protein
MHTELNFDVIMRHVERQRDEHMEQGRRLRELSETEASTREALAGRWHVVNSVLSLRWNLTGLLPRKSQSRAAGVA